MAVAMNDADLGDIYVDHDGKLWRVMAVCGEPTVHVQEVESLSPDSPVRRSGGISGLMWNGFRRIYRPDPPKPPPSDYRPDMTKWAM